MLRRLAFKSDIGTANDKSVPCTVKMISHTEEFGNPPKYFALKYDGA